VYDDSPSIRLPVRARGAFLNEISARMSIAIVLTLVSLASLVALLFPTYAALRAGDGVEGACLDRHSQSTAGAIQDLPIRAEVSWRDATLRCEWPGVEGDVSQIFVLAAPARQVTLACLSVAAIGGAVVVALYAGKKMRPVAGSATGRNCSSVVD